MNLCNGCAFYDGFESRCTNEQGTISTIIHAYITYNWKCDKWDYKNNTPKYHKDKYSSIDGIITKI